MAKAGDTIESPPTGARIRFLKTARDTNGELLQIDDVMKGGGRVAIEHIHPYIEERFEILSGTARFSTRGQQRDVGAGETVVVPAGTPHVWGNPNEDEVHLIIEFRPALRMEEWLETFFGLQQDGKANPNSGRHIPRVRGRALRRLAPFVGAEGSIWAAGPSRQAARIQGSLPQVQLSRDCERRGSRPTIHNDGNGEGCSHGYLGAGGIHVLAW
jgi:mannose-6-phosphate isomerase-like protein (cupin superfamily)